MALTTYYVNADVGLDTNSGLSAALPYKTIAKAFSGTDLKILIATGMSYDSITATMFLNGSGTPRSRVTVDSYVAATSPNSDYPVLECGFFVDPLDSGWTEVSGYPGIWKKVFHTSFQQGRVFVGAYGKDSVFSQNRSLGEAVRRATVFQRDGNGNPVLVGGKVVQITNPTEAQICAEITPTAPYYAASSAASYNVYIYTGSGIAPPLYYGGLYISGIEQSTLRGSGAGISAINVQDWDFSHICLRGAPQVGVYIRASDTAMSVAQDAKNLYFHDLDIVACMSGTETGLHIASGGGAVVPSVYSRNIVFERVSYDLYTNANEQEPDETFAYISGGSDGMKLGSGTRESSVHRCTIRNAGHGGLVIGCSSYGSGTSPESCVASYNSIVYDGWTTYSNPMGIAGGQYHVAHHNIVGGATYGPKLSGGVHFYKNEFRNQKQSTRKIDGPSQAIALETTPYDLANGFNAVGQEGLRYIMPDLIDVLCEQNSFSGAFTHAIEYAYTDSTAISTAYGRHPLFPSNKLVIRDNVILGTFAGDVNHTLTSRFLVVHNQYPAGFNYQLVQNNVTNIPSPNSTDECYTNYFEGGAMGDGTNPFAMNGMTGSTGNIATDDPKVDSAMNPLPTSPLIGTATFIGYMPDIRGVQESNPPSKGARAYQAARTSRLT